MRKFVSLAVLTLVAAYLLTTYSGDNVNDWFANEKIVEYPAHNY